MRLRSNIYKLSPGLRTQLLYSFGKQTMEEPDLDWGSATPEAYDDVAQEALHILNVNFIGKVNRNRVVKFVCARVLHFHKHLPKGCTQRVRFDLRGQLVSNKNLELARQTIIQESSKHGIQVSVEFLTN